MSRPWNIGIRLSLAVVAILTMPMVRVPTIGSVRAQIEQIDECQIAVPVGWQPYLVRAGDTLETLAAQRATNATTVTRANCLAEQELVAGMLLLLPRLDPTAGVASPGVITETGEVTETGQVTSPFALTEVTGVTDGISAPVTVMTGTVTAVPTLQATASVASGATATVEATSALRPAATPLALPLTGVIAIESNILFVAALLIMVASALLLFALRPWWRGLGDGQDQRAAWGAGQDQRAAWGAGLAFLIGGFVVGTALFPWLQGALLAAISAWLSAGFALGLLLLLVLNEYLLVRPRWHGLGRLLNLLIAPLLMLVLLTLVSHISAFW